MTWLTLVRGSRSFRDINWTLDTGEIPFDQQTVYQILFWLHTTVPTSVEIQLKAHAIHSLNFCLVLVDDLNVTRTSFLKIQCAQQDRGFSGDEQVPICPKMNKPRDISIGTLERCAGCQHKERFELLAKRIHSLSNQRIDIDLGNLANFLLVPVQSVRWRLQNEAGWKCEGFYESWHVFVCTTESFSFLLNCPNID